jgi:NAD(P)H-hydrate epimerase
LILNNDDLYSLDVSANKENKIPFLALMEEAATKISETIKKDFNLYSEKIAVIAGFGNNGGDALSVARKLLFDGFDVDIYIFADKKGSDLYIIQLEIMKALKIKIFDIAKINDYISSYSLIIDGIFGIGYKYRKDETIENIFTAINNSNATIISIDTPSGLNTYNNISIEADYTYSIGFLKEYFFNINSRKKVGLLKDIKISFDIQNIDYTNKPLYINQIEPLIKDRSAFVHKYKKGGCISIGGMPGKYGSIIFTAKSALKVGAGISLIITEKDNIIPLNIMCSEVIIDSFESIDICIDKYKTIMIGPGLNINSVENKNKILSIFNYDKNFILDASFFTIFDKSCLGAFKNPPILTPHSNEFINFFTDEADEIKSNTINTVTKLAKKYNCYIILKESFLVIASPLGQTYVFECPMRIMAQAGSGDILTGIIGGLISQGYDKIDSIMEAIRIFYSIGKKFYNQNSNSYTSEKFIEMIENE